MHRPVRRRWLAVGVAGVGVLAACAGSDPPGPLVDRIDDAVAAVESFYGEPPAYVEISATESVVSVIVDTGAGAEQSFWSPDDGLVAPVEVPIVDRPTFPASAIDFRPDRVLDQLRDELPNSDIVDFAVTGVGEGAVIYDARLQSDQGGVLLVLVDGDGRILGVQGE